VAAHAQGIPLSCCVLGKNESFILLVHVRKLANFHRSVFDKKRISDNKKSLKLDKG